MLPDIMIVIGGILIAIGIWGLLRITFEPIQKAFEVVFDRRDDHVYYETDIGKSLLKKEMRVLMTVSLTLIVIGFLCIGTGLIIKNINRGSSPLWSDYNYGLYGDYTPETNELAQGITANGTYINEDGKEYVYFILIHGNDIRFSNLFNGKIDEFENFITTMDRSTVIYVIDDFASSGTYNKVVELLDHCAMKYEMDEK